MSSDTRHKPDSDAYNEREHVLYEQLYAETELYRDRHGGQQSIVRDGRYTMPEPACAYVIECDNADDIEQVDSRTESIVGYNRDDMRKAYHSRNRFQVGSSQQILTRLEQHINDNGSLLTGVFKPTDLRKVVWCNSYSQARAIEEDVAIEYQRRYPDSFVWQK